jgi:predicted acetyltransferase
MEFRTIEPGELDAFYGTMARAFSETSHDVTDAGRARQELDRTFAAIDGGAIVGTAATYSFRTVVPGGGSVPAAGLTEVGVLPTHRRRGVMRELLRRYVDQARERGEPLATLFAAEAAIYGRFGFGRATPGLDVDVDAHRAAFVPWYEPAGRTRLMAHADALQPLADIYRAAIADRPGANLLEDRDVPWVFGEKVYPDDQSRSRVEALFAIHEDGEGVPDAYAVYTAKHAWPDSLPNVEITLDSMAAATPQAAADMWRYLIDVDLVSHVKAWNRPADDPLHWLLQEPRAMRGKLLDSLLARPLDVASSLASRGYARDGAVRIGVADAFLPDNDGVYDLRVDEGRPACARSTGEPMLSGPVNAIGAVYFGGATWTELANGGMVREHEPGSLAAADAMFSTPVAPWAAYMF